MKLTAKMCHTHLLRMLSLAADFEQAVGSYTATKPLVSMEGMNAYIETTVTFEINDLKQFTRLWDYCHDWNRTKDDNWYPKIIRNSINNVVQ